MTSSRHVIRRHYLPNPDEEPTAAQVSGPPRPGYGTIYVTLGHDLSRERNIVWVATWVDEYPQADQHGATVGHATIEGDKESVLHWVRRQPAADFLIPAETPEGWKPLPDRDDDVSLSLPRR